MEFVLDSESSLTRHIVGRERERRGEEATDEDKLHARWALLLDRLGIVYADDYEKLVSDYLNAGLVDRSAVDAIIDRYRQEQQRAVGQARAGEFFQSTIWDPEMPPEEIVEKAKALIADIPHLDCYTVSSLHDYLAEFDGGISIGEHMVSVWIEGLRDRAKAPGADAQQFVLDNWIGRPLHPAIVTAFAEARGRVEQPKTLLEAWLHLAHNNGWGRAEEAVIQAASVNDFKQTILSVRGEQFKVFLLKNLDIYAHRATYVKHFGTGPAHFFNACKEIFAERTGTRWAKLIEDAFNDAKLGADLRGEPPATWHSDHANRF